MIWLYIFLLLLLLITAIYILWPLKNRIVSLLIFIFLTASSLGLYFIVGDAKGYRNYLDVLSIDHQKLPPLPVVISSLKNQLAQHPESIEGWYLLGRIYLDQQNFPQAQEAFSKAYALNPTDEKIQLNYADSLLLQKNPAVYPLVKTLLMQVLKKDPSNEMALNLLAILNYEQKQFEQSIHIWEKLSESYPADSDEGKALLKAIAKAQEKLEVSKQVSKTS